MEYCYKLYDYVHRRTQFGKIKAENKVEARIALKGFENCIICYIRKPLSKARRNEIYKSPLIDSELGVYSVKFVSVDKKGKPILDDISIVVQAVDEYDAEKLAETFFGSKSVVCITRKIKGCKDNYKEVITRKNVDYMRRKLFRYVGRKDYRKTS